MEALQNVLTKIDLKINLSKKNLMTNIPGTRNKLWQIALNNGLEELHYAEHRLVN